MIVSDLFIYPIKSTSPVALDEAIVQRHSIEYDREWAIFDNSGQVLTAREYPQLLDIQCQIEGTQLVIKHINTLISTVGLRGNPSNSEALKLHSYHAFGHTVDTAVDEWFSDFLNISCRLMKVDLSHSRPVLKRHGGHDNDIVGFGDQSPLLIISRASLQDLNLRLDEKVKMDRFRPNIVIDGCEAFEEDDFDIITIGSCTLRIIHQCERCVLTTIDPVTKLKHQMAEPLRTLATYRKGPDGGVVLGVRAVTAAPGTIKSGDKLKVISTVSRRIAS